MALTLDGTSGVTYPSGTTATAAGVGDGQTWQAVTRTSGTTYTNTTGKPIAQVFSSGGGSTNTVVVSGVTIASFATVASNQMSFQYVIPVGASYSYSVTNALGSIYELR